MSIINWRAGNAVATSSNATSETITVPSAVQKGDAVFLVINSGRASSYSGITGVSSTATTPSILGSEVQIETGGVYLSAAVYHFTAGSSDAGATITCSTTGSSTSWRISIGSWYGAATRQPDVAPSPATSLGTLSVTTPTATTGQSADWAVYLVATTTGASFTAHPGTLRENDSVYGSAIADSNGSVGAAGTSIGGGTWTASSGSNETWAAWTVGLAAASGAQLAGFPS